jgi:hypothetical protein
MRNVLAARGIGDVVSVSIRQVLAIEPDDFLEFAAQLADAPLDGRIFLIWEWLNDNLIVYVNAVGRRGREGADDHEFRITNRDMIGVGMEDVGRPITVRGQNLDILRNVQITDGLDQ